MSKPFQPADGQTPRWRHCYDLVTGRQVGDQVTLLEVTELLDCSPEAAWAAMRQARIHLEGDGCRTVRTVPRFGWVVMAAAEHLRAAEHHTAKARRQVVTAHRKVRSARREELSQFEREAADRMAASLTALSDLMGRRRRVPLGDLAKRSLPPAAGT